MPTRSFKIACVTLDAATRQQHIISRRSNLTVVGDIANCRQIAGLSRVLTNINNRHDGN
jgi:hypothetical protein